MSDTLVYERDVFDADRELEKMVACELCDNPFVAWEMASGNGIDGYVCYTCERDEQHEHHMSHRRYW